MYSKPYLQEIPTERWICIGVACAVNRDSSETLKVGGRGLRAHHQRTRKGIGLCLSFASQRSLQRRPKHKTPKARRALERLYQYCAQDVRTEIDHSDLPALPEKSASFGCLTNA